MVGSDDWGIKISEEGEDVLTATDKQLILSSGMDALKIKTAAKSSGGDTVAHGLAYTPAFLYMCELDTSSKYGIVGQNYYGNFPYTNGTNIYVGGKTKYIVLYQEGATT